MQPGAHGEGRSLGAPGDAAEGGEGSQQYLHERGTIISFKEEFLAGGVPAAQISGPMFCFNCSQIFFNNPEAAVMWVRCVRAENKDTGSLYSLRPVEKFPSYQSAWLAPARLLLLCISHQLLTVILCILSCRLALGNLEKMVIKCWVASAKSSKAVRGTDG